VSNCVFIISLILSWLMSSTLLYLMIVCLNKHSLVTIVLCYLQVLLHLTIECVLLLFVGGNFQVSTRLVYCSVFMLKNFSNTRQCPLIKYGEKKDPLIFD